MFRTSRTSEATLHEPTNFEIGQETGMQWSQKKEH